MIYVFTSAAWNYLPKAHLLATTVKKHIPGAHMVLALPDQMTDDVDIGKYDFDEVMAMDEKLISVPKYKGWVFSHSIVELATAIKPFVLCKLLERRDCEAVLYFDPDIMLFSDLNDMLDEFNHNSILLCPHVTIPEVNYQSIVDNELGSLKWGVYNFGYVGVKNDAYGYAFANWWRDRCMQWCYDDVANGIFTDQKWNDLVPGLFDGVKVLRSSRFDVAVWNTTRRKFSGSWEDGFKVNGEPLGFYHFTGFDSGAHDIMLQRAMAPEVQRQLTDWYRAQLKKAELDPLCQRPWAYRNYTDGTPIPKEHRAYYHTDPGVMDYFRDPYDVTSDENNYRNWYFRNIKGTAKDITCTAEAIRQSLTRQLEDQKMSFEKEKASLEAELKTARLYAEAIRQSLTKQLEGQKMSFEKEKASFEVELKTARFYYERKLYDFKVLKSELEGVRNSASWKLTKPLRLLKSVFVRGGR